MSWSPGLPCPRQQRRRSSSCFPPRLRPVKSRERGGNRCTGMRRVRVRLLGSRGRSRISAAHPDTSRGVLRLRRVGRLEPGPGHSRQDLQSCQGRWLSASAAGQLSLLVRGERSARGAAGAMLAVLPGRRAHADCRRLVRSRCPPQGRRAALSLHDGQSRRTTTIRALPNGWEPGSPSSLSAPGDAGVRMTAMRRRLDAMVVQEVCCKGCDCFVLVPGVRALQDILSNGWRPPPTTIGARRRWAPQRAVWRGGTHE